MSEVISTYVYKIGLINADFSYSAAIGLFNSAVNMIMLLKAKECSESDHSKILERCGGLLIHYDHIITSYDKNFYVNVQIALFITAP